MTDSLTYHEKMFSELTGIADKATLSQIEDIVRNDIFHSTLDWQTKAQLKKAAKEAIEMINFMNSAEGKLYMAELEAKFYTS